MTLTYACAFAMFGLIPFCLSFLHRGRAFWLLQAAAWLIFLSVFMTFSRGVWISLSVALVMISSGGCGERDSLPSLHRGGSCGAVDRGLSRPARARDEFCGQQERKQFGASESLAIPIG